MKILADASLPDLHIIFKPPFQLTLYQHADQIPSLIASQDALLCRSTLKVTASLLANSSIRFVATASSGVDHIDETYLHAQQITLLHAKGSNATAVADYVLASVAYLKQHEMIQGTRAAVIGVGAVGQRVASVLAQVGFQVLPYDPPRSAQNKQFCSADLNNVLECDLICLHANLHETEPFPSKNLFNRTRLSQLSKYTVIINASRGGILNEADLLSMPSKPIYCTDVYINEPNVNPEIINYATLCTPHIAGHSIEAKRRAVVQVAHALSSYIDVSFSEKLYSDMERLPLPTDWEKKVLSLYNPELETRALKQATDKKEAFLQLRQSHYRHDMNWDMS